MINLHVDTSNVCHRGFHVTYGADTWTRIGVALHIMISGLANVQNRFQTNQTYFYGEGKSWRKSFYPRYKANRDIVKPEDNTPEKQQERAEFRAMMNQFLDFVEHKTNAIMLKTPTAEADDLIARVIQLNPNEEHIILSADTDFDQLLAPNVQRYDPIKEVLFTIDGAFTLDGKVATDSKGEEIVLDDPEYTLFKKCIRGDRSDNVLTAYPGVREAGTKNKVGIRQAFADRHDRGADWNNFMKVEWLDHEQQVQLVENVYQRNRTLIDLTMQPEYVIAEMDAAIQKAEDKPAVGMIGIHFVQFANQFELNKIKEAPSRYLQAFKGDKLK